MKSSEEIIAWIASKYSPGEDISYDEFDEFCEVSGMPWLERQNNRIKLAKRINTILRRGVVMSGQTIYASLMVNDKGKSFLFARLPEYSIHDYHRSCKSAASIVDSVHRDMSRLLGHDEYESPLEHRVIRFRGARPILSRDEQQELERAAEQLAIVRPLILSLMAASDAAINSYRRLLGPQPKLNDYPQLDFDGEGSTA